MPRSEEEIRRRQNLALADSHIRSSIKTAEEAAKLLLRTGVPIDHIVAVSIAHQADNLRGYLGQISELLKQMDGGDR